MALLKSQYNPKGIFKNPHVQTIYANFFRKVTFSSYSRQRVKTPDNDFFDLDWLIQSNQVSKDSQTKKKLIIVLCGMEGHSGSSYVKGFLNTVSSFNFDAAVLNYRGCSGEVNKNFKSYHAGFTDDLWQTLDLIEKEYQYQNIFLVGFSLGGNIVLKFLAELENKTKRASSLYQLWSQKLRLGIAISAPLHLKSTSLKMIELGNRLYLKRFLNYFYHRYQNYIHWLGKEKVESIKKMKSFQEFDDTFTAPFYGYRDAEHYWQENSSCYCLSEIKRPVFILISQDDMLLSDECYDEVIELAKKKNNILFELTEYGGHLGFVPQKRGEDYWHEKRTVEFILSTLNQ